MAAIAAAGIVTGSTGAQPAPPIAPTGHLLFSDEGTLFTIAPDGTGLRELGELGAIDPRYSPDGTLIAYAGDHQRIWISRDDGSGGHWITAPPFDHGSGSGDYTPAWSPRGDELVFRRLRIRAGKGKPILSTFRIARLNGGGPRSLTGTSGWNSPDWSPDGRQIAGEEHTRLWVAQVDGSSRHRLGPLSIKGRQPRWSPEGRRVAYLNRATATVRVLDVRTGRVRTVFDEDSPLGEELAWGYAWSPDGRWLAVMRGVMDDCVDDPTATECDHVELWVVNLASATADLVYTGPDYSEVDGFDWQPT